MNCSRNELDRNVASMIDNYNSERLSVLAKTDSESLKLSKDLINVDSTKVGWTGNLFKSFQNNKEITYHKSCITKTSYRPYFKQNLYFNRDFNERVYQWPIIFPESTISNIVICITGIGVSRDFSTLITDCISNYHYHDTSQVFPLYYYEKRDKQSPNIFDAGGDSQYIKNDGVSDFILNQAKEKYNESVTKEDIFYYVYGVLHSPDYRTTFANDLKKMLPRIPLVEKPKDFWAFSKAGRDLAELHLNYESVAPYPDVTITGDDGEFYTVEKMRFPKKGEQETIIYNSHITISDIPDKAYEYVVNGKSAIAWIMERYQVKVDKKSGIKNDPNDWAKEVNNPRYILDLLLSIINVSVQTVNIVNGLPKMEFED